MANKVYNMEGGLHSAQAFSAFENAMYGSCVADIDSYKATAGTGMNVTLSTGNGLISTGTGFARRIASDATNTVAITASSTANPRKDVVVAYIDNGVTPTTTVVDNTNNILKFKSVAGTPAASPVAPTASAIQTSVGAGNPYMILWEITVPKSATSLTGATFTDKRNIANIITGDDLDDGTVTVSKLDASTIDYSVGNPTSGESITLTQSWQAIIQSGTLPAGTYLVFCEWYYNVTSLTGDMNDIHVTIATSATNAATTQLTNEGIYNGWNHGARTCIRKVALDSDKAIGLYMKRVTTAGTVITSANRCSLNIIRVA